MTAGAGDAGGCVNNTASVPLSCTQPGAGSASSNEGGASAGTDGEVVTLDAGSPGASEGGGSCTLSPGTYTVTYSLQPGGSPECPTIPIETVNITSNSVVVPGDAGSCTTTESCTMTCTESQDGATISLSITTASNSAMGVETINENIMAGGTLVSLDCTYDFSYTM